MPSVSRIRRVTPARLELDERPWAFEACLGVLSLLIGLALSGLLYALWVDVHARRPGTILGTAAVALLFLAGGAWASLGRVWIVVDASRRSVTRAFGLVVPWRTRTYAFGELCEVRLRIGTILGICDAQGPHELQLARHGRPPVRLCTVMWWPGWPGSRENPAVFAAEVARLIGVPWSSASATALLEKIGRTRYFGSRAYETYQSGDLEPLLRRGRASIDPVVLLTQTGLVRYESYPADPSVEPKDLLGLWRLVLLPAGAAVLERAGIELDPAVVDRTMRASDPQ